MIKEIKNYSIIMFDAIAIKKNTIIFIACIISNLYFKEENKQNNVIYTK